MISRPAELTPAEREVLQRLAAGQTVKQIAYARTVSQATVRSQVHRILSKLNVSSQLEAVLLAHRMGESVGKDLL